MIKALIYAMVFVAGAWFGVDRLLDIVHVVAETIAQVTK